MANAHRLLFRASGTSSAPRFSGQVLSGLEMALWDLMGKATDKPVHALLGGAVREDVSYFGFAQGATADEVAADALVLSNDGFEVIYVKAGRGDTEDLRTVAAVRDAIGVDKRIRVDPNEQWKPGQALRMIRKLLPFDVEYIEQPTHAESISSLAQVHSASPIAISADQSVFTPFDAFEICRQRAADLLVVGLHETGGLLRLSKVAHVAEAAGLDVCLHSLFETGISTCAANQVAATIPNLDDANQHMTRFLAWDLVKSPDLRPRGGKLSVSQDAGLGFQMDWDGVERAKKCYSELKDRIDFSQGVPN
jgi:muconate cycloisomerase